MCPSRRAGWADPLPTPRPPRTRLGESWAGFSSSPLWRAFRPRNRRQRSRSWLRAPSAAAVGHGRADNVAGRSPASRIRATMLGEKPWYRPRASQASIPPERQKPASPPVLMMPASLTAAWVSQKSTPSGQGLGERGPGLAGGCSWARRAAPGRDAERAQDGPAPRISALCAVGRGSAPLADAAATLAGRSGNKRAAQSNINTPIGEGRVRVR